MFSNNFNMFCGRQSTEVAKSFIAVAEPVYGQKIPSQELGSPQFYTNLKQERFFDIYCGRAVFDQKSVAKKNAARRSVVEESAYVISLDCSPGKVKELASRGALFEHVLEAEEAQTGRTVFKKR